MLYRIEKSNHTGRWTGRQWWVEATDEAAAIEQGRKNWPSKNSTDQYHAVLLTDEDIEAYYAEQFEIEMRLARRGGLSADARRRADRKSAYLAKCGEHRNRALDRNVDRVGLVPAIETLAERIDARTEEQIDHCYRM